MELTREEKQALEEKYKEQRRSMWAGKHPSDSDNMSEDESEEVSENSEEADSAFADNQDAQPAQPETDNILARIQALDEDQSDATEAQSDETSSRPTADESEQIQPTAENVTVEEKTSIIPETNNATSQIVQKIRKQREDTWEGNSATRSRRRRRKASSKKREFWNPMDQEEGPSPFTWKLVLGVFGVIIVLVGIGILFGYWFAS